MGAVFILHNIISQRSEFLNVNAVYDQCPYLKIVLINRSHHNRDTKFIGKKSPSIYCYRNINQLYALIKNYSTF